MSDRDVLLGRALDALVVPEHRSGFTVPHRRVPVLPLVGMLAAAAIVVATVALAASLRTQTASAADVLRAVAKALQTPHTVSGIVVGANYTYSVLVARDGSYRTQGIGFATAYDASTQRAESWSRTGGVSGLTQPRTFQSWRNVDPGMLSFALNQNGYALSLHSGLALARAHVTSTRYEGRAAWRLDLRIAPNDPLFIGNGYRLVLVIDRETGYALSLSRYLANPVTPTSTIRIERLRIDPPAPRRLFRIGPPAGATRVNADWRFRAVTPLQARGIVGYRPLLPTDTRGLDRIALAASPLTGTRVPTRPGGPPTQVRRDVVSAVYGNGFAASIAYSTRHYDASEGMPPSDDINNVLSVRFAAPHPVKLVRGAFAGTTAWVSASPFQNTYLWVAKEDVLVRIASTLSSSDVIAVANSIEPA
jgi:hypothetical protein